MGEILIQDQETGIGSNGTNISFNYYDGIPDASLVQSVSDNNLLINIKKLFKKDDMTKEKALNSIVQILKDSRDNINDINVLIWSMVYPKLVISESRFVKNLANDITFDILNYIKEKKIKNLLPYYKDLLPVLVFSLQDSDKAVVFNSKKHFNELYDNDVAKVDNLYITLRISLLKIVYHLLCIETEQTLYNVDTIKLNKDLMESISLKHSSLRTSAVKLLTMVIFKNDQHFLMKNEYLTKILNNGDVYEPIGISFVEANGKNGFMCLLELIIIINNKLKNDENEKNLFWKTHKKAAKYLSKKLFKLLSKWKQNKQQLLSPLTNNILLLLNGMLEIEAFWKATDECYKILFKWLLLGPGVFTENGYYTLLKTLSFNMLNCENPVFSPEKHWIKIWRACLTLELQRNDRQSKTYFNEFWNQFLMLYNNFKNLLDVDELLEMLKISLESKIVDTELLYLFKENGLAGEVVQKYLLDVLGNKEETDNTSKTLITNSVAFLEESKLEAVISECVNENLTSNSVFFLTLLISSNKCSDCFKSLFKQLDNDVLLAHFINSEIFNLEADFDSLVSPKLNSKMNTDSESVSTFLSLIENTEAMKRIIKEFPNIYNHLLTNDGSDINIELVDLDMAKKLFESKNFKEFVSIFDKFPTNLKIDFMLANELFIYEYIYEFDQDEIDWLESLADVFRESKQIVKSTLSILQEQLSHLVSKINEIDYEKNVEELVIVHLKKLSTYNSDGFIEFITESNILSLNLFFKDFTKLDTGLIDVSGFNSSSLLFYKDMSSSYFIDNKDQFNSLFILSKFVALVYETLPADNLIDKNKIALNLNILQLLISHFSIITKTDSLDLNINALDINLIKFEYEIGDLINFILEKNVTQTSFLNELQINDNDLCSVKFYKFKVLSMLLANSLDLTSKINFVETFIPQLESDLLSIIRTNSAGTEYNAKFINSVLLLDAIHIRFGETSMFNKLVTYLMSEFHQLKPSEFESRVYKFMIILTNMFVNVNGIPALDINLIRFNGFIKIVKDLYDDLDWYEDELTYKQHFRVLYLQLFINLNTYESEFSDSFKDFSESLLIDNLQICELLLESNLPFDVLISKTLKLYSLLDIEENESDINESLFNLFANHNSVPDSIVGSVLVSKLDETFISSKYDCLVEKLSAFESKDGNWLRTCILLILRVLKKDRKVNAIDFELDRKQLLADGVDVQQINAEMLKTYSIDKRFIDMIDTVDYKENILLYLGLVEIVLEYLKETTLNLYNLYMDQLGKNWFIDNVFEKLINDLNVNFDDDDVDMKDSSFSKDRSIRDLLYSLSNLLVSKSSGPIIFNWYNNLKAGNEKVNSYFIKHISTKLIEEQIGSIMNSSSFKEVTSNFSDFLSISINEKFNTVKAKFDIDDQILEVNYQYEKNFPLQPITTIIRTNKIGIEDKTLKAWLLNLKKTSNIVNNVSLICNNIKLKFANLEECAICYYIINDTNKSLPNKKCPTCFKKFHNVCLFKWFKNSNSNTCPLCRSNFVF